MKRGKQYQKGAASVDRETLYSPGEAIEKVRSSAYAKFDETLEVHFNLGIDPRHADQQLRGTLVLPNGTGRTVRVAAVVPADKVKEAQEAGADTAGSDDLVEQIQKGWLEFDILISTPDMMGKVGKLGRILGAKGLMPNPKSGTVTPDFTSAIKEFKAGKLEYRNDKTGIIHLGIGKLSFTDAQLRENFQVVYDMLLKVKPAKSKGIYLKSISLNSSMGPGVFLEPLSVRWKDES